MNKWMWLVVAVVAQTTVVTFGLSYVTDKESAMIVTKARITENGQGQVLGEVFENVVFSHKETKQTEGILTLQTKLAKSDTWVLTERKNDGHYLKEEAAFLTKLRKVLGPEALPETFRFYDRPASLTYSEGIQDYFLLEKVREIETKALPEGSIKGKTKKSSSSNQVLSDVASAVISSQEKSPTEEGSPSRSKVVETSILVEIGSLEDIRAKEEAYKKGENIYNAHFALVPLLLEVFESRPGVAQENERRVGALENFDLRFHRRDFTGHITLPTEQPTVFNLVPVCRVVPIKEGSSDYYVVIDADEFIKKVVMPRTEGNPALRCVTPDEGHEEYTACRAASNDPCGQNIIEALVTPNRDLSPSSVENMNSRLARNQIASGKVTVLLEPTTEDPTLEYRVELSLPSSM